MYYELYLDVLFLVNFLMDYLLLLFVWKVLHCDTLHRNIAIGAILGAVLTCVLILLPIPSTVLELLLFHVVVNTCMIRVGLKIKCISDFLKALILLYIGAFFMGGILESFYQYAKLGSLYLVLGIGGYYLTVGMWKFLSKLQRWNTKYVTVDLVFNDGKKRVKGLIDTGNSLYDSISGKPVSVISPEVAKELLGEKELKMRYIPYQSIGKKDGKMPIFCIDKMCLQGEVQRCLEKPCLGIAEDMFSENEVFELILNPDLL